MDDTNPAPDSAQTVVTDPTPVSSDTPTTPDTAPVPVETPAPSEAEIPPVETSVGVAPLPSPQSSASSDSVEPAPEPATDAPAPVVAEQTSSQPVDVPPEPADPVTIEPIPTPEPTAIPATDSASNLQTTDYGLQTTPDLPTIQVEPVPSAPPAPAPATSDPEPQVIEQAAEQPSVEQGSTEVATEPAKVDNSPNVKEVIKEVPVEKIVEKEVIKEVPVEKVVYRESEPSEGKIKSALIDYLHRLGAKGRESRLKRMHNEMDQILKLFDTHPHLTHKDVVNELHLNERTASRLLRRLVEEEGKIRLIGGHHGGTSSYYTRN